MVRRGSLEVTVAGSWDWGVSGIGSVTDSRNEGEVSGTLITQGLSKAFITPNLV